MTRRYRRRSFYAAEKPAISVSAIAYAAISKRAAELGITRAALVEQALWSDEARINTISSGER